ncbi:Na+/H+ antiporter subunit E [Megalodesulfovibrio gigas]|uniref:Na+/H+ antiporter subunit E n=1 Tax=Megalodesulfovibrio gigas TaxID=879 RepID=UPI00042935C0|nr:Na+/H+ antiporter subunit E [Megalodesulfovibrio gigas]
MDEHRRGNGGSNGGSLTGFVLTFIIMMLTWCILSGFFDSFHLSLGIISSLIVAWSSHDLLFSTPTSVRLSQTWRIWMGFPGYFLYLIIEIWKANIYVLKLCFAKDVERAIDPHLITFKTTLKSRLAMVTLANSITLTPGTITVEVDYDGVFTVHALDSGIAEGLLKAETNEMQTRIAKLFGEV